MKKTWIMLGAVVLLALILGGSCVGQYNELVTLNESVTTAWAQVENVLQRRNDLIPNLVNTVQGYASHERGVFQAVTEARAKVGSAQTIPDKVDANNQLTSALSKLMLVVENYPELKANQNFMALQDELAGTENRIAVERMRYNDTVKAYNVFVRRFPNNFLASIFGYARENVYFKAEEGAKVAPKVQFNIPPVGAPAPAMPAGTPPQAGAPAMQPAMPAAPSAPSVPAMPAAPAAPSAPAPSAPAIPVMPAAPTAPTAPSMVPAAPSTAPVLPAAPAVPPAAAPAPMAPVAPVPAPAPVPVAPPPAH